MKFTSLSSYHFLAGIITAILLLLSFSGMNRKAMYFKVRTMEDICEEVPIHPIINSLPADSPEKKKNHIPEALQNDDSARQNFNHPEDGCYWFISINIHPNILKIN